MKKLISLVFTAILISSGAIAQGDGGSSNGISFGLKGGVNFASVSGDMIADEYDGRTGFLVGGVVNIPVSELLAVQPEVFYSQQGFTGEETEDGIQVDVTGRLDYINIPVLADFTVAEGFSLQGGPQLGILVTDEFEAEAMGMSFTDDAEAKSIDFGAAIGAQYRTPIGLFFQARYYVGLMDGYDGDEPEIVGEVKNNVFSIAAGWFF